MKVSPALIRLAAVLLIGPAAPGYSEPMWSTPEVTERLLAPGVLQRIETASRNFKGSPKTRNIEKKMTAELRERDGRGRYVLVKRQVYSSGQLLTFYRKLDASLDGPLPFRISEQSQISRHDGAFKGTVIREFRPGEGRDGPAVRVKLHFEHRMLVTVYKVNVYTLPAKGVWSPIGAEEGASADEVLSRMAARLDQEKPSEAASLARFVVALWRGTQHSGPLDLASFVYPFVMPGGEAYFDHVDDTKALMDRARAGASQSQRSRGALNQWGLAAEALTLKRKALAAALRRSDGEQVAARSKDYALAARNLLDPPQSPTPTQLQNLQTSMRWIAQGHASMIQLPIGGAARAKLISELPGRWAQTRVDTRAELYIRALYVFLMGDEARELGRLSAKAGRHAEVLRDLRSALLDRSRSWRTLASGEAVPGSWLSRLISLPGLLASSAWASDFRSPAFEDSLHNLGPDPFTYSVAIGAAMARLPEIPEKPSDINQVFDSPRVATAGMTAVTAFQTPARPLTQPACANCAPAFPAGIGSIKGPKQGVPGPAPRP